MAEPGDGRVAVYIDFDNIIISRYDQVNGRNAFQRDKLRSLGSTASADPELAERLERATVDIGAVIDFASSFGTLVLTRAYADWSAPMNADYRGQLVGRAVDLVQLFPAAAYAKNGADIRLAVDAVEDLFRLPDLTHIVLVAGDSDYIALAQRCKRLGRYVVGIGMAGSTSKSLAAACDEFVTYDDLPGVAPVVRAAPRSAGAPRTAAGSTDTTTSAAATTQDAGRTGTAKRNAAETDATTAGAASTDATGPESTSSDSTSSDSTSTDSTSTDAPATASGRTASTRKRASRAAAPAGAPDVAIRFESGEPANEPEPEPPVEDPQDVATRLLERALRLGHEKDDAEWLHSSSVKSQIKRMDPSFSEKTLGYRSFSDFIKSRDTIADLDDSTTARLVRLTPALASHED